MSKKPFVIVGVLAILAVGFLGCSFVSPIFWMMLGSPWPIDLSAFAE
jgi:hypothetical protein